MIQSVTPEELKNINKYRRSSSSAFLTIMFTAIKNFNQIRKLKGIDYIKTILALHNTVLEETIEKDGAGLVAKRIDDSFVGVFASPTAAIDRAVQIQASLKKINDAHPELENIEIMIGLDTGQVTVGDEIQVDLFNHHLKRAYELQNMASGKQILLSYTPEDWVIAQQNTLFAWKNHGQYTTPDLSLPLTIYEVAEKEIAKPKPPQRGKKKKTFPWIPAGVGLLLLVFLAGGYWFLSNKASVWFIRMPDTKIYVDQKDLIVLDGTKQNETRKSMQSINTGNHILHYNVHYQVKYFSEINITKGKNFIEPQFTEFRLPDLSQRIDLNSDNNYTNKASKTQRFQYDVYTKSNKKKTHNVIIELTVKGRKATANPDPLMFDLTSSVTLDGKVIHEETRSVPSSEKETESMRFQTPIYQDEAHYYFMRYWINYPSAKLEVGAAYIDYLKPAK